MKKIILAITATTLILSIIISACLISHTQSINVVHETSEIPDENQQATSVETTENDEKPQENIGINASRNQAYNINDVKEVENPQSTISNESPQNRANINQDEITWTDTCPPDGRIYYPTQEPPYAYTPTYTPTKWIKLPVIPIEPN